MKVNKNTKHSIATKILAVAFSASLLIASNPDSSFASTQKGVNYEEAVVKITPTTVLEEKKVAPNIVIKPITLEEYREIYPYTYHGFKKRLELASDHPNKTYGQLSPEFVEQIMLELLDRLETEGLDPKQLFPEDFAITIYLALDFSIDRMSAGTLNQYDHSSILIPAEEDWLLSAEDKASTIYHEIGHVLDNRFFVGEPRDTYKTTRDLWGQNGWFGFRMPWDQKPVEVFAEDFKTIFLPDHITRWTGNNTFKETLDEDGKEAYKNFIIETIKKSEKYKTAGTPD